MEPDLKRGLFDLVVTIVTLASALFVLAHEAAAAPPSPPPGPAGGAAAAFRTECGACHVAYPAKLLPASSWRAVMGQLDRHFGVDASLDPALTASIASYLTANGGREPAYAATEPNLRVTQAPKFVHEHGELARRRGVAATSFADCAACHPGAANGSFDERSILIRH